MYQKYTTALKVYAFLNLEKERVHKDLLSVIPRSTMQYWKNQSVNPAENVMGYHLEEQLQRDLGEWKNAYHPANYVPLKLFLAYSQMVCMVISFFDRKRLLKQLRANKEKVIHYLDEFEDQLSVKELSQLFSISDKTIYNWKYQIRFKCMKSPISMCLKRHPNQATQLEVALISKYLNDQKYAHWGIQNVWAKAFKENATSLSKYTWYRYNLSSIHISRLRFHFSCLI